MVLAPANGILDTFRWRTTENSATMYYYPPEDYHFGMTAYKRMPDIQMKDRFTLFKIYQEKSGPTEKSMFYQPIQGRQFCYRNSKGSVECKLVSAHHTSYSDAPYHHGGVQGKGSPGCRQGLVAVGIDCLYLPHGTRKSRQNSFIACANMGGGLYSPHNQVQNKIIHSYLEEEGIDGLWTAVKRDIDGEWRANGLKVSPFEVQWAENEPQNGPGLDCTAMKKSNQYKLVAVSCNEFNDYLCMAVKPNCPEGYTWVPEIGQGKSCFRIHGPIFDPNPASPNDGQWDVTTADELCARDKTRLWTPESSEEIAGMYTWTQKPDVHPPISTSIYYLLGIHRYRNLDSTGNENFWIYNSRNQLSDSTANMFNGQYLAGVTSPLAYLYSNSLSTGQLRSTSAPLYTFGLCQYTESTTVLGKTCKFPFRYKSRVYDTCITIDSPLSTPICTTQTDDFGDLIKGAVSGCSTTNRTVDCPVGFYWMHKVQTCFKMSSARIQDSVQTYQEAETICHSQGARLLQLRSHEMLQALFDTRYAHFTSGSYFYYNPGSIVAIGMKYGDLEGDLTMYYPDMQPMDPVFYKDEIEALWAPGQPDVANECVGFKEGGFLVTYPCNDISHFNNGNEDVSKPGLAYICEAKTIKTIGATVEACHFPFIYKGKVYDSCAFDFIEGLNPNGEPWCALEVNENQEVVNARWGLCQDERHVIVTGPGNGNFCPIPFIFDRVYYDRCTRIDHTKTKRYGGFFWCPDPSFVSQTAFGSVYVDGRPVGTCPEILHPEDGDCAENYDAITDSICVRVSAYPETFDAAQEKCQSEGGFLLQYLNNEIHEGLALLLAEKHNKLNRMSDVKAFWIGAKYDENWHWTHNPQTFPEYNNWEGDIVDIGCSGTGCNSDMALTASSNYNPEEVKAYPTWIAGDKGFAKPYICQSKCYKGYHWFPQSQRCLKVVHTNQKITLGDAMMKCSKDDARLMPIKRCEDISSLMLEIHEQFSLNEEQYFIGLFGFNRLGNSVYRNWREDDVFDSLGFGNIEMDASSGTFCEESAPTAPKEEYFVTMNIEDEDNMAIEVITFNQQNYADARHEAGYVCEKEDSWGCPDGYQMNFGKCYKLFRTTLPQIEAEQFCFEDSAILATPKTFIEGEFIESYISAMNDNLEDGQEQAQNIWVSYRQADPEDPVFFTKFEGKSTSNLRTEQGNCLIIKVDDNGIHQGLHRRYCNDPAFFICEKNETLKTELQPYVPQPLAIFPLSLKSGPKEVTGHDLVGLETNVAYDPLWTPAGLFGSPLFDPRLLHTSKIAYDLEGLIPIQNQLTILFWLRPAKHGADRFILKAVKGDKSFTIQQFQKRIGVTVSGQAEEVTIKSSEDFELNKNEWNFVAFSFNGKEDENYIFINEGYGFDLNTTSSFNLDSYDWMNFEKVTIGGYEGDPMLPFEGSISCLQVFGYAMDHATISMKKYCNDLQAEEKRTQCYPGSHYYDGYCYKIMNTQYKFSEAEVACLPESDSNYNSKLMWIEKLNHFDFVSQLVKKETEHLTFWVGLSDMEADGFYTSSSGENITGSDFSLFKDSSVTPLPCTFAMYNEAGYLQTSKCDEERVAVCISKPLYAIPDFHCPNGFYPYQSKCLFPSQQVKTFDAAKKLCASKGSIVLPIKDQQTHEFIKAWGLNSVGSDIWIGLRNLKHVQFFDDDPSLFHPLQEDFIEEYTYTDDTPYEDKISYDLDKKKFSDECLYMRQAEKYDTLDSPCNKEKGFICEWLAPECPEGYEYAAQLSDGRTCHGVIESGEGDFETSTCDTGNDLLRSKYTPISPLQIDRFRRQFVDNKAVWTGTYMDGTGQWTLNEEEILTDDIEDLRRAESETWPPDESVLDVNGTTDGCVEVTKYGLLHTQIKDGCLETKSPACEYKACMTTSGKKCLFPFVYDNQTHPELTYTICSGLDVYRPWCPTKLSDDLHVLEWGDCIDDCPRETINSACLQDPRFPSFADGSDQAVNYTSNYTTGISFVTDELDYVAFDCPQGYVFEGSKNKTHYAICLNWEFIYLYDEDTLCVPVECPPVPTFVAETPIGENNLDLVNDPPQYLDVAQFSCPEGYTFKVFDDMPNDNGTFELIEDVFNINLTCSDYADWLPLTVPECIPINCTDEPVFVNNDNKGMYDWDGQNKSFGALIRYYCDLPGWGFPSSGGNEMYNECQADKSWSLTEIDDCICE